MKFGGELSEVISADETASGLEDILERMSTIGNVVISEEASQVPVPGTVTIANGSPSVASCDGSTACFAGLSRGDLIWVAGEAFSVSSSWDTTDHNNVDLADPADSTSSKAFPGTVPDASVKMFTYAYGHKWTIEFVDGHIGDQPLLEFVPGNGWIGSNLFVDIVAVTEGLAPLSGTFRVSLYDGATGTVDRTKPLPFNIDEAGMKAAIEGIATVSTVSVTRHVNGYGYDWYVDFVDMIGPVGLLEVDSSQLTGPSAKITVSETTPGVLPSEYGSFKYTGLVNGVSEYEYVITGLTQGLSYRARVSAHSSEGYGPGVVTSAPVVPSGTPGSVTNLALMSLTNTQIKAVGKPCRRWRIEHSVVHY